MIKQYVAFGDYATQKVENGNWAGLKRLFEDSPSTLGKREFKTEEERQAYLCGLQDATGWMDSYPLDADEVKKLSKRIRLSDIDDLSCNY